MANATDPQPEAAPEALVDAIYQTITAPQAWPDLLRQIGDWLEADCGLMMTPAIHGIPPTPLFVYGLDVTPIIENYPRYAGRAEYTHRALATGRVPGAFLVNELLSPAEQATDAFWQDIVAPTGLTSGVYGMVRAPLEGERPMIVCFYRLKTRAAYVASDVTRFESLFPHLRRALGLALDAPARRALPTGVSDLYDAIGAPCFLIGADGAVAYHNHAAQIMLAAKDGVVLKEGRLILTDAAAQKDLAAVLARTTADVWTTRIRAGTELLARRPSGGAAMVVVVTPLGLENPIAALTTPVRCAVYMLEEKLRANGLLPARLQRLYGLTEAETQVAIEVAAGSTLYEIAMARGTAISTVRSQVKTTLGKTSARRQADLAALVNRLRF